MYNNKNNTRSKSGIGYRYPSLLYSPNYSSSLSRAMRIGAEGVRYAPYLSSSSIYSSFLLLLSFYLPTFLLPSPSPPRHFPFHSHDQSRAPHKQTILHPHIASVHNRPSTPFTLSIERKEKKSHQRIAQSFETNTRRYSVLCHAMPCHVVAFLVHSCYTIPYNTYIPTRAQEKQ